MVGLARFPHSLKVRFKGGTAIKDENGDWIGGDDLVEQNYPECREQPNSKGAYESGPDGKKIEFNSLVFIKGKIERLAIGSEIEVFDGGLSILKGTVLKFSSNLYHSRIWV